MHAVRTAAGTAGSQALLDGFTRYLRAERGVSAVTVDAYLSDVGRFLARRGGSDPGELTAAGVSKAVLGEAASRSPASVRRYGCALRSFLHYCYLAGLIEHNLSAAALPVSGRRRPLLPQGIGPAQAKALLGGRDRRRATGRRDYAVIVLMPARGRARRCTASLCAANGRYWPLSGSRFRRSSRLIVDGLRPSRSAIARTPVPALRRSAIRTRSSSDKYRSEISRRATFPRETTGA